MQVEFYVLGIPLCSFKIFRTRDEEIFFFFNYLLPTLSVSYLFNNFRKREELR